MLLRFIHQWSLRPGRLPTAALSLAILLALMPLASAEVTPDDPVVADVVRMLDAGIESDLVVSWLQTGDRRPAALSADALIALTEARASRELIEFLLAMATAAPISGSAADSAARATTVTPEAMPPQIAAAASHNDDCCLVEFSIRYRAAEDKDGGEVEQASRDLFLYADGQLLTRIESQGDIASGGPVRFKAQMAPGAHTLRFTRQLHTRKRSSTGNDSWEHETTVSPSSISVKLEPGALWQLDFNWVQSEFSTTKPLRWSWSRNGVEIAGEAGVGEFRERWPFLCEDVEISRDSGAIAAWRARDRLKSCVSWASLWPGSVDTTRAELLHSLRRFDFQPVAGAAVRID